MASPPQFLSFPDIAELQPRKKEKKREEEPVPSFSSFPDLPGLEVKRSSRHGSEDKSRDEERHRRRRGGVVEEEEREDREGRKRKDKDGEGRGERRHREDRTERRRSRSRDRERTRQEPKDRPEVPRYKSGYRDVEKERNNRESGRDRRRDRSAERRWKEERRKRERDQAQALIRGDINLPKKQGESSQRKQSEERWEKEDDGVPWYETKGNDVTKPREGERYGQAFDPSTPITFFYDVVGDRDIYKYGAMVSHAAPRYNRDGNSRILGYNSGLRIVYSRERTQKGIEVAPKGRPFVPRYNKQTTSALAHTQRILLKPSQHETNPNEEYLAFERKARAEEDVVPAHRSITHQPPPEDEDEERDDMRDVIGSYSTMEQEVRQKTSELESHLYKNPQDIPSWLAYSQLHLQLSPSSDHAMGQDPAKLATTKAQAEVTLSILSKALDAAKENGCSVQLHMAYLTAAETVWSADRVTKRWKNVLRELGKISAERPGSGLEEGMMSLWLGYIAWRQGQGFGKHLESDKDGAGGKTEVGGVDEVVDVYVECIGRLKDGAGAASDLQAREENLVYLFLRACLYLKQSGYDERALAAFQALMEITFFKPDHLLPPRNPNDRRAWFQSLLTEFEVFWDTEAPRIGEPGAVGWRNTRPDTPPPPFPVAQPVKHTSEDPFERWLESERHYTARYACPGRATDLDAETEDDPFHTILLDDISPLLFPIFTPGVRLQLIYAFLTFLGLPFTPEEVTTRASWNLDPHLRVALLGNDSVRRAFWPVKPDTKKKIAWQTVGGEPMDPVQTHPLSNPFSSPVKSWVQSRSTLFSQVGGWFRDLDKMDVDGVDVEIVRGVWGLIRPLVPDPGFTLLGLGVESAVSAKGAVKVAKTILAEDRTNLYLWDGYARLEHQRGNVAASRTVYTTALQAALQARSARDGDKTEDEMDLWAGWAGMEFEEGQEATCLEVCLMASGVGEQRLGQAAAVGYVAASAAPISVLKAKQYYMSIPMPLPACHLQLCALLIYLTEGIESARDMLLANCDASPSVSAEQESSYQLLTKMLYMHAGRHASRAGLMRDVLERACGLYPNNTGFLSLYMYGELQGRVYGRTQRLIAALTDERGGTQGKGVVGHLWAVWAEAISAHRTFWDGGGAGAGRVRVALDRAINSRIGKHCGALWVLYVEFETHMGRVQAAKQLCYRAVAALGGVKALYLLPFSPSLRPHFSPRELTDWSELMAERGIRVRVPFELAVGAAGGGDGAEDEDGDGLPEDEALREDELAFLTQRQALKPY